MSDINNIAMSALHAFGTGQQVTANNLANVNTDGFKASKVEFRDNGAAGVAVSVSRTEDTVDISREATSLISNASGFKANLTTIKTADEMAKELFSLKA